ncbi:hypothetical protein Tco_0518272 [Tanacetum coccineum]
MAAPTIHVPVEKNLRDLIESRVVIVHPTPIAVVAFPAAARWEEINEELLTLRERANRARHREVIRGIQERLLEMPTQRWEEIKEELLTLRERANRAETEGVTLRARVRSLEVVETWLHGIVKDKREARERIERQLGLVQEELESLKHSKLS